ncbi:uncharacterized protein [Venturia canescens]|uniref:uncharacterized protein n=1 Tax=Venturia canescens TaxID=32260 RepID=UPI001C9CE968|nr:uncharacterized protein LOC122406253 [Venturia canescens]
MEENRCFLCKESLDEGKTIHLKEKALGTLIKASVQRRDDKHRELRGKDNIVLHSKCHKSYTHANSIQACINAATSNTCAASTRSGTATDFDFETNCLFCEKDASETFLKNQAKKKNVSKRETVSLIKDSRDNLEVEIDLIESNEDVTYALDTNENEEFDDDSMVHYSPTCKKQKTTM